MATTKKSTAKTTATKKSVAKSNAKPQTEPKKVSKTWLAMLKAAKTPGGIEDMRAVLR